MARLLWVMMWVVCAWGHTMRVAWFVPLTTSALLQRFHVTVQSIHDTQRSEDQWILAVVADEAIRDTLAKRSVDRVTHAVIVLSEGIGKPLVDYFAAGYAATRQHLVDTSTVVNETVYAVWMDVDTILVQSIHDTLLPTILPTQIATVPTDTSALYTCGKHFVVLGPDVALVLDKKSLYTTLGQTAVPHVTLNASYSARVSDLHNYRSTWLALKPDGCKTPKRSDSVLCGITSVYYDVRTFAPWHWWTYPLVRINYPWILVAAHVDPRNIPWYIWLLKISHFLVMFVVLAAGWWMYSKRRWLPYAKKIWPPSNQLGPMQKHISWVVRIVFFVTYLSCVLLYPEEIWPWYGWTVAILWMMVMCITLLDGVYYPWIRHQGEWSAVVRTDDLSVYARRHLAAGPQEVPLELLRAKSRNAFWVGHFVLFLGIMGGVLLFGLLIGEGRTALVFLAAFMVSALSWFTGFVSSTVRSTAFAAYERGWVERRWKEEDPTKES